MDILESNPEGAEVNRLMTEIDVDICIFCPKRISKSSGQQMSYSSAIINNFASDGLYSGKGMVR